MSCCHNSCTSSQPRIRCTPTFFHHPIFEDYGFSQTADLCQAKRNRVSKGFVNKKSGYCSKKTGSTLEGKL